MLVYYIYLFTLTLNYTKHGFKIAKTSSICALVADHATLANCQVHVHRRRTASVFVNIAIWRSGGLMLSIIWDMLCLLSVPITYSL